MSGCAVTWASWLWAGLWVCALGCSPGVERDVAPRVVLLVSLDTTRADALACYQDQSHWGQEYPQGLRPVPQTPTLDGIAGAGVRFAWALAHAPTTLNSHASVFSGLDPHAHRVVRNGYPIPDDVPLVTELFQNAGWDTIAVIGSSALEAAMGLNRGFRRYHDPGPQPVGGMYMLGADEVTRRALEEVDAHLADPELATKPLFLFVHYYDAHTPWFTAPSTSQLDGSMAAIEKLTRARVAGKLRLEDAVQARALYLAQVTWVDTQLGLLLSGLGDRGLMDDALTVVFADHGETLEESSTNPYTHGPSVGLVDVHVPLIFSGSGLFSLPSGLVEEQPVRLMDVASTMAELAALENVGGEGISLVRHLRGLDDPSARISFAEATKPIGNESPNKWNNLPFERSVTKDGLVLRGNPLDGGRASLYRVAAGEPRLSISDYPQIAGDMAELMNDWDARAPSHRSMDASEETQAGLKALGYLE